MSSQRVSVHGMWSSRAVFIMATVGSAVGLGNIWKFPYITGQYGGGAFVVVYLACIALIGIPIMMAEILLGRRGRSSPISTMKQLAREEGASPAWSLVGYSGVVAGFPDFVVLQRDCGLGAGLCVPDRQWRPERGHGRSAQRACSAILSVRPGS